MLCRKLKLKSDMQVLLKILGSIFSCAVKCKKVFHSEIPFPL